MPTVVTRIEVIHISELVTGIKSEITVAFIVENAAFDTDGGRSINPSPLKSVRRNVGTARTTIQAERQRNRQGCQ